MLPTSAVEGDGSEEMVPEGVGGLVRTGVVRTLASRGMSGNQLRNS